MQFKRIIIKNFQSIKDIELVLEENRCYHIKGDNNIGKSSFLKALEAVARNVGSRNVSKFIRDGEDSFYIEVSDFDNNVVRLSRGLEDYYSWDINGESGRVDKTAGKVPDEVREYFNFYEDMEKSKEIVNIRSPRSRLLFIDTTNPENYYLLQKALKIEEYLGAIKLGDSKKREYRKEIQVIERRLEGTNSDIDNLKDYSLLLTDLEVYEDSCDILYDKLIEGNDLVDLFNEVERKESFIENTSIVFDKEYNRELLSKIKLISEIISLTKNINIKEKVVEDKSLILNDFESSKKVYEEVLEIETKVDLVKTKDLLESRVNDLEETLDAKRIIINDFSIMESSINNLKSGLLILDDGNDLRNRLVNHRDLVEAYDKSEEDRKVFMVDNKFCPVVLSMKDKKCPFSGKALVELLDKG